MLVPGGSLQSAFHSPESRPRPGIYSIKLFLRLMTTLSFLGIIYEGSFEVLKRFYMLL